MNEKKKRVKSMRLLKLVALLSVALVTQSCKVTMPTLIELIGSYEPYLTSQPSAYHFNKYSKALQLKTGFKDVLLIGDRPGSEHEILMRRIMFGAGIPEENLATRVEFVYIHDPLGNDGLRYLVTLNDWKELYQATRVVHLPLLVPLYEAQDIPRVSENNVLFVIAAGNVKSYHQGDRDMYNINHVMWNDDGNSRRDSLFERWYRNILEVHNTGKVLAATSAEVTEEGEIEPNKRVVSCGDIKKACFTMIPAHPTSSASARLASMSFYLAQFYPTVEEIVETLEVCAVDVGEEGIDREYGRGIANLLCPRVLKKELAVVQEYLGEEKKEEEVVSLQEELLEGVWVAESTSLEVYLPLVLRETLGAQYQGEVDGTLTFKEDTVEADFHLSAAVKTVFLMPIEAKAEDAVQTEGVYSIEESVLTIHTPEPLQYTYTVTEDSLKLIRSFTLNEVLRLLPGVLGELAKKETEDWFQEDPIRIIGTFAREILLGDFDRNNIVEFTDFLLFTAVFGTDSTHPLFNQRMDLVPDGMINFADFLVFVENFGKTG